MTSGSNALTFTGLPAEITPTRNWVQLVPSFCFIDAGSQLTAAAIVSVDVASSGTISVRKNGSLTGWTNTVTSKGFNNVSLTLYWALN
jgi:hypothetical protein